jgi:hypothetical protein
MGFCDGGDEPLGYITGTYSTCWIPSADGEGPYTMELLFD